MEMGWTGGHQEQHVKQKSGVMAIAYPKCQLFHVTLRQTKPYSREEDRGWGWRWRLTEGSQQLLCMHKSSGGKRGHGVEGG